MNTSATRLIESVRRWTLILGILQVTVGCLVGLIPPDAVEWFRGIVMAHIEFTANGVLMVVLGLLVRELRLGPVLLGIWFLALQVGTWTNGGAGLAAGFLGASSPLMPTLNARFPPPFGADSPVVTGLLQVCGVAILLALLLTLYGLWRNRSPATGSGR